MAPRTRASSIDVFVHFLVHPPHFGDLLQLCGFDTPGTTVTAGSPWLQLETLGFTQIDDYFGIWDEQALEDDAAGDVVLWLFPWADAMELDHEPGPFEMLKLTYPILRNPPSNRPILLQVLTAFAAHFEITMYLPDYSWDLVLPQDGDRLMALIEAEIEGWRAQGIEPGSDLALQYPE